ncbi:MAG: outer membrane beta-barrel protein [Bacteroidales bacterium]|nr:outer membrane beta-barrel protein [Bacteroidales bacterium]
MKNTKMQKMAFAMVALLMALEGVAMGQKVHVSGRVTDNSTGEPMPFVNVAVMRPVDTVFLRGATTDFDGRFNIVDVDAGSYLLQASFVGYKSHLENLEVINNIDNMEIALKNQGTTLEEVQVVAEKPLYMMDGEKNMYNTKEDPSIQTGTASDALQNAPGVEVDAEGNITLRGVSSVEIWINDRPSHMNEEALKQYIKTMPANAIERIEVITNPSARYSTGGGVINIVTNQTVSRNELLCVGLRGTTTPVISPWVSYVWANEKVDLNFYLTGNYGYHKMENDGTSTLLDDNGDTSRFMSYDNKNKMPYQGGYMGFNTNWQIDDKTTLSAWMGAYPYWDQNSFYGNSGWIEYQPVRRDLGYRDTTLNHGFSHGAYAGAWFEHRYDTTGRKLSVTFNGNYWANSGYSDYTRVYNSAALTDFRRHMEGDMLNGNGELGVNYTLPLKHDITLEAGAEVGYDYSRNSEIRDSLLPSGVWDNILYQSYVSNGTAFSPSVYMTAQKRWGGFTTKLGLRYYNNFKSGEIEHPAVGDRQSLDTLFSGLIPSIHLSYQTKTFESYSLSYTRRFSHDGDLSSYMPFRIYEDFSFNTGNPNLLMSYTHNLEAAFNKYVMSFGNIGLNAYFRANTDEIGQMTAAAYDPVIGPYMVNYTFPDNIGSSHTEGLEANITYRPTGFFNVRCNALVFNYGYNYNGDKANRVSWSARVNVWAKVKGWLELFANAHYSSPRLGLYSLSNANKGVDFGASADFFDRRLSVNITVNDIIGKSEWGSNTTAPQYQTTGSNRFDSQFVSFGLTWRMGKMELESKARQGATDNTPQM